MRRRAAIALAAGLCLGAGPLPAAAQGAREGAAPGEFDFYVLALSWSPGFCALEGDRKERSQCEPGRGLGFVVHGLWPQYERGYPVSCGSGSGGPPRAALEEAREVYPEEGLARHQWRKHGVCSGLSPLDYVRTVRRARDRVTIPERLATLAGEEVATALDVERAFAEANPGLRPDMMAVHCPRRMLQEVRVCLDRDLRGFRRCPEVDRNGCGAGELRISARR